ncbi:hypothetical protein BDM02DRAFT_3158815 [Thelephora ganbajun]|uniref:Uncharacterized protein n=1 Tax=Thelephora ganbajun TaxID=370292 RepID=A0ACB6ZW62_THEGA|nr:hypothetical protein BDM02DRAFT_3158815 [Thelephora ganbajun]
MILFQLVLGLLSSSTALVLAQSCQNYGLSQGSSCLCPPGFGGSDCSLPACSGTIFQGSNRRTAPAPGNLTSAGCMCQDGWSGVGCNVCTSHSACQSGYVSQNPTSGTGVTGTDVGQNNTMVCNSTPRVWAAGEMSCSVINPTLQAIYPGASTLNIIRTLDPTRSPMPNLTSLPTSNTIAAQLFYNGVEQFFCTADSCMQSITNANPSTWECQNLKCTCISNATFCGGVPSTDLTSVINKLDGTVTVTCDGNSTCSFGQSLLKSLFGPNGLSLSPCSFGECVRQSVIDAASNTTASSPTKQSNGLNSGVIAGLAVVGGLLGVALLFLLLGWLSQRKARKTPSNTLEKRGGYPLEWNHITYVIPHGNTGLRLFRRNPKDGQIITDDKVILDDVSGRVDPGQMMAILGPSGAGKTTLIEILSKKSKSGIITGGVSHPGTGSSPRIGFVPQQDTLPPTLTVSEALLFAARLRLPESVSEADKVALVDDVMEKLGIGNLRNTRIGDVGKRGISGGEMRRVSIGLELVAHPDILILDEPTSGLDSVSASKVASVLHSVAHDPEHPTAVIASIHQPNSQLYQKFDKVLVLSHGRIIYNGPGGFAPSQELASRGIPYPHGYNVADHLLDVASDPPAHLFQSGTSSGAQARGSEEGNGSLEKGYPPSSPKLPNAPGRALYATTFLTQLEVLSGREWKILRRDKSLFLAHLLVSAVLGVFCGGLYFNTGITIAGFQSRVGGLFFLGALIAFSTLSALYNLVQLRPLFLRERASGYYSPTAWLLSRFAFDVIPLRIIPNIIIGTIMYWMAGLAKDPAHFFKFLFIIVLYTLAMTLWNFLLAVAFENGGIATLVSALSALYQMTFAGFFVHLNSIPPVLRWLQWLCPLKYTLEALCVNEVGSGLMVVDTLEGVPVNLSASLLLKVLFGFSANAYYRDVLVFCAFIAGFAAMVIFAVWVKVKERR